MTSRSRFCQLALEMLGKPVLMGAKTRDVTDCSGLVTSSLKLAGGPDLTQVDNAQKLFNESRPLVPSEFLPGDLVFYGLSFAHVEHVGIYMVGGKVLSADGATYAIKTLEEALQHETYRVRLHDDMHFRRDLPGNPLAVHRNHWVDDLDLVSR